MAATAANNLEIELPSPHTGQASVLQEAKRFNVLETGRRWGKSRISQNLLIEEAVKGYPVALFAPTNKFMSPQWHEILDTVTPIVKRTDKMERQIELITGGVIDFWSLENIDSGRGRKYKRVNIDEASLVRDLKKAWLSSIRPTLTDLRGDAWFFSTPKGHNYFHSLFAKGQSGETNWASWRRGTIDNPYIDAEEIAEAKADLPDHIFNQEYLGIPADDGGNPFGIKAIRECTMTATSGIETVWYGIDLAKAHDYTVVCGFDRSGQITSLDRWQSDWGATKQRILDIVGNKRTLVDSTGVGDPIVEDMQRSPGANIEGFRFTSQSKQQLMEGLAVAIQRGDISIYGDWLVNELEMFRYEYRSSGVRYSAPEGMFDDGVCALALANWLRIHDPGPPEIYDTGQKRESCETAERYSDVNQDSFGGLYGVAA
jgi:hypothetical protein